MKKRVVSILLVLCMVLLQLPVVTFAVQEAPTITGISITVDGVTYTEGNVTIKPDSTVVYTITGTNLNQQLPYSFGHAQGITSIMGVGGSWDVDDTHTILTRDYSDRIIQFAECENFRVYYVNESNEKVYTDLYLTFDPGSEPAQMTSLELVVDGVSYTEGHVNIYPESEVEFIVRGQNLYRVSDDIVIDTPAVYVSVSRMGLISPTVRSQIGGGTWFGGAKDYPITFTNDGWKTTIDSGITVTYVTGVSDGPAEITGLAIVVDGVSYTEGNVTIRPNSKVSFIVTGLNLTNVNQQQIIDTPLAFLPLHSIPLQEDGTYLYTTYASCFVGGVDYNITYTNDGWGTTIATDIYVTYQEQEVIQGGDWKLNQNTNTQTSLTEDLYVDLNGFDLTGTIITNGFKVYGKDSTTDGYTCADAGSFACVDENGNPIVPERIYTEGENRYLAICQEGRYSFHCFFVGVTHMTLAPEVVGLGYKSFVRGDEMVFAELAQTNALSFRVQLWGYRPVYRNMDRDQLASNEPITLRISNYDVEKHSERYLYAQVSLTFKDGTVVETQEVALTFRWLTEQVNADYMDYTPEQLADFSAMLQKFTVAQAWDIPNILGNAE